MDGVRCIYRLHETAPDIVTLVHTVESDSKVVFPALQAGAVGHLLKGLSVGVLRQAVSNLMAGGSVRAPSIARRIYEILHVHSRGELFARLRDWDTGMPPGQG